MSAEPYQPLHDAPAAQLVEDRLGRGIRLIASGNWTVARLAPIDPALRRVAADAEGPIDFDLTGVERLDTAGAWLVQRTRRAWHDGGVAAQLRGASREQVLLLESLAELNFAAAEPDRRGPWGFVFLAWIGARATEQWREFYRVIGFLGLVLAGVGRVMVRPRRFRMTAFLAQMERVGLQALGIVLLLNFLIGVVLAYQGLAQLEIFGAQVFTVNLVAVSILREIGILLTAIIVAGRSGSAFAAEIGSMKIREEIDAMRTIGLDEVDILILPRVLALSLAVPMLGVIGDVAGLIGGGLMIWGALDISPAIILSRLSATDPWHLAVGLIKAPVFGALIATIGCYEGMKVQGSAESVGRMTTESVVKSIFTVIIVDAIFSIFFARIGV